MDVGSFFAGVGTTIGLFCVGIVVSAIVANIKINRKYGKGEKRNG